MFGLQFPYLETSSKFVSILVHLTKYIRTFLSGDELPELEGVGLPFLTRQTIPQWPLPPLKRQGLPCGLAKTECDVAKRCGIQ